MILLLKRLVAFMIDWVVLFCVFALPQFILALMLGRWVLSYDSPPLAIWAWVALTVSVPSWIYFTLSDSSAAGATLGKRLFGLAVRDLKGGRIGQWRALARTAVKLAPWEMTHIMIFFPEPFGDEIGTAKIVLIMIANALLIVWLAVPLLDRPGHRAIHDLVARTRVIRTPAMRGTASFRTR